MEKNPSLNNPIIVAQNVKKIRDSENPLEKSVAELMLMLEKFGARIGGVESMLSIMSMGNVSTSAGILRNLFLPNPYLAKSFTSDTLKTPTKLPKILKVLYEIETEEEQKKKKKEK